MDTAHRRVLLPGTILALLLGAPTMTVVTDSKNLGAPSNDCTVCKGHLRIELVILSELPGRVQELLHDPVLSDYEIMGKKKNNPELLLTRRGGKTSTIQNHCIFQEFFGSLKPRLMKRFHSKGCQIN
jgi:hypothetical protein